MAKSKILIVCDHFPPPWDGGGSVNAEYIYYALNELGYNTKVLSCNTINRENERNIFRDLSHKSYWVGHKERIIESFQKDKAVVDKILEVFKPDLIFLLHVWNIAGEILKYIDCLSIRKIYRFGDESFRLHCVTPPNILNHGFIKSPMERIGGDLLITNSKKLRGLLREYTYSPIKVIPNPVRISDSVLPPTKLHACFVGRIVEHKGIRLLLEVVRELHPLLTLDIVGPISNPAFYSNVRDHYNDLQDNNIIRWIGPVSHNEISQYISGARYLVFPSTPRAKNRTIEGCPNVMLEAWALKRLLITSSYAGHKEYIEHGYNSYIVDSVCVDKWIEAIRWCHENLLFYDQVTSSAYNYVKQNHSFTLFKQIMEKEICTVLSGEIPPS